MISAAIASGCSTQGMWPAPRIRAKRAPGMLSAVSRTRSAGVDPSASPARTRTGWRSPGVDFAQVGPGEGGAAAEIAGAGLARHHRPPAGELLGPLAVEGPGEPCRHDLVGHGLDAAGPDGGHPRAPAVLGADLRRRVREHGDPHEVRPFGGEALGDDAADRQADEGRLPEARRLHQRRGIGHEIPHEIVALRRGAEAMAAQVVAQDPKAGRQQRDELVPDAEIGAERMGQDDRCAAVGAGDRMVEANAVDAEDLHAGQDAAARSRMSMPGGLLGRRIEVPTRQGSDFVKSRTFHAPAPGDSRPPHATG